MLQLNKPQMPRVNLEQVINILSQPRLKKYLDAVNNTNSLPNLSKAMLLYQINISYCESLYPVLQIFEISLRNSIDKTLSEKYNKYWFLPSKDIIKDENLFLKQTRINYFKNENYFLLDYETNQVIKAIHKTIEEVNNKTDNSAFNLRMNRDKIMANLTLGFWTALITQTQKSNNLYLDKIFIPCIKKVFPYAKKNELSRSTIVSILEEIRRLRNRVFHHEPIWYDDHLYLKHNKICRILNWIEPNIYMWMRLPQETIDRFPEVYETYTKQIKILLNS